MMSFRGRASWAKMILPGGNLTALACHKTKKVNKAVELPCLSTNINVCNDIALLRSFIYFFWSCGMLVLLAYPQVMSFLPIDI